MDFVDTMVFGALSSLVASAVYLALIFLLRPRIRISPELVVGRGADGRERMAFKVRNLSRWALLDIQAKASYSPTFDPERQRVGAGQPLNLEYSSLFDLGRREGRLGRGSSTFVFTFTGFPDDLAETDGWVIRVGVTARHVLSQFGGVAKHNFAGPDTLVAGRFQSGVSFRTIEDLDARL